MNAARILLESLIDYAGLFPPAGLRMADAVHKYSDYRRGKQRWMLGKFIVPVARLGEFSQVPIADLDPADPWPLSVLGGADLAADLRAIAAFKRTGVRIVSLEIKAASPVEVERAALSIRGSIETFYEIPIDQNPLEILLAIQEAKGFAKIRTGGTKPGMVPIPEELSRFLHLAGGRRVAFKATAGLHHALRSVRPLTDEPGCESDLMHGFLNVFVAACFAVEGLPEYIPSILDERDIRGFRFGDSSLSWHNHEIPLDELRMTRQGFALSFGSCSFEEPIAELKGLGLL